LKVPVLVLAGLFACSAAAQEIVTLQTRPGVTQSFFIANMGGARAQAAALLFVGGGGNIRLRREGGQIRFEQGNFLPRSRREFIRNGIVPVVLDNPSDQQAGDGMSESFRAGAAHAGDVRAVLAEVKRRFPGLPVFLVGTSKGTLSAAWLAAALEGEAAGAVLTSTLFYEGPRHRPRPVLAAFDWSAIKIPVLFVHHLDDACFATPHYEAARLGRRFPLVTVKGVEPAKSGPCDPFSAHGFLGREAQTVDAIAGWMLGKPYPKEIR
jgi:hypothetical protein